jgi:hypothetical protein
MVPSLLCHLPTDVAARIPFVTLALEFFLPIQREEMAHCLLEVAPDFVINIMVDHLKESPTSACLAYLFNKHGLVLLEIDNRWGRW